MWRCQKCESDNPAAALFCQSCGEKKAASGITEAPVFSWQTAGHSAPGVSGGLRGSDTKQSTWLLANYLQVNAMAGWLNFFGNALFVLAAIAAIITLVSYNFPAGLLTSIGTLLSGLVLGLVLKALGRIWQNSDDIKGMLRYQIDMQKERDE